MRGRVRSLRGVLRGTGAVAAALALLAFTPGLEGASRTSRLTVARLQYDGDDWYANPSSLPNLIKALRARTTAGIIAAKLGYADSAIVEDREIYNASTAQLLKVLRHIDESHQSAVLFGHVPGVLDLTNSLCPGAGIDHFPTCSAAIVALEIDYWGELDEGCGKLIEHLIPKQLLPNA